MFTLRVEEKRFGAAVILRDISLALAARERVAILGPSGIGKTTLLRIAAGLDRDFTGVRDAPENIALMFQNPNLLLWRNVFDNLRIFHPRAGRDAILDALEAVGIAEKVNSFPLSLSLGQQRRLALARSFLGGAEMVLLDEPYVSLDRRRREEMLTLTREHLDNSAAALMLVTHDESEARALGARIIRLEGAPARFLPARKTARKTARKPARKRK